jgi:hypothetical protein
MQLGYTCYGNSELATQSKGASTMWNAILTSVAERKFFLAIPLVTYAIFLLMSVFGSKELRDVVHFLTFQK